MDLDPNKNLIKNIVLILFSEKEIKDTFLKLEWKKSTW